MKGLGGGVKEFKKAMREDDDDNSKGRQQKTVMTFDRIEDLHRALDSGQTTCAKLAEEALRRASEENPRINALAELFHEKR